MPYTLESHGHLTDTARRDYALALRRKGLTFAEIGRVMEVSRQRAKQLVDLAEAEREQRVG